MSESPIRKSGLDILRERIAQVDLSTFETPELTPPEKGETVIDTMSEDLKRIYCLWTDARKKHFEAGIPYNQSVIDHIQKQHIGKSCGPECQEFVERSEERLSECTELKHEYEILDHAFWSTLFLEFPHIGKLAFGFRSEFRVISVEIGELEVYAPLIIFTDPTPTGFQQN